MDNQACELHIEARCSARYVLLLRREASRTLMTAIGRARVECSARLGPHPEDEDTVQPDASDRNEAQSEGQAPDQAEAVGVRILLGDGLDVADAEQDEQDGDVGEVAHTLQRSEMA